MEAPERIYLTQLMLFAAPTISSSDNDVEYIRKDAFIEKACDWFKNNVEKYYYLDEAYDKVISVKNLNKNFKKYMEL